MKIKKKAQSIEPNIADLANSWLKSYNLDYKLEQESLNAEIDKALSDYYTKNGGAGANRPDAKILLQDKNLDFYPVLIEYKGYKDKLVKFDKDGQVENRTSKNEPYFKNINSFAVNGAVHYANALLHHTSYTDIIAIGVTGYKDETGKVHHEIGVYYVSKSNLGAGQKVGDYIDFSFLAPSNFDSFIGKVKRLQLTPDELDKLREQREKEIDQTLSQLNQHIFDNEKGISEKDRVYLVAASIIATIGVPDKVTALDKSELKSSAEKGNKDGDIILRKIKAFLDVKDIPNEKKLFVTRALENTLTTENLNKVENGESQLKRVFTKIVDDLGIYYKIGLTTDFTGKLFNEMYGWLGFSQDKLNDVVLTPSYVASLLVKLARVNKDTYVWDFATGSAGLLVAAMNEMLNDAKDKIKSPDLLIQKEAKIKAEQLLGLELLPDIYMLAILNMILMGDGSSNILNVDSVKDFDGNYGFGRAGNKFPADAFILNPPYSAFGNGMNFVEKALGMMDKGYAAIIIQNSAGSGKAINYTKSILAKHTLLASIRMPLDIFIGKSSVQTNIYVFKVNEAHHKDEMVKFIDFSNDGYSRSNRKKANSNLKNTDRALERYQEVVDLVRFGRSKLKIFTEKEYYENTIDPKNGADWNQSAPIMSKPKLHDFKKSLTDYLAWDVSNIFKNQSNDSSSEDGAQHNADNEANIGGVGLQDYELAEKERKAIIEYDNIEWREFKLDKLFERINTNKLSYKAKDLPNRPTGKYILPCLTSSFNNQGLNYYAPKDGATILKNVISIPSNSDVYRAYFQSNEFTVLSDAYAIRWIFNDYDLRPNQYLFVVQCINKVTDLPIYSYKNKLGGWNVVKEKYIQLPVINDKIDYVRP